MLYHRYMKTKHHQNKLIEVLSLQIYIHRKRQIMTR